MNTAREVVVVAVARTPFGRFGGALKNLSAIQLGARAMAEAVRRSGVDAAAVEALYAGVGMIGANVLTATRQALLLGSGLPETTPSLGVDRACCSGMTAIGLGFKEIRHGESDLVLCGGFESLSNTPFLWPRQRGTRPGAVEVADPLLLRADFLDKAIARYTGEEAIGMGVDRLQQDLWAVSSHRKYFEAQAKGYFEFERFPLRESVATLAVDEGPRSDVSEEKLGVLSPVYQSPTITAGNAPGLNDGAAFILLASRSFAIAHGLTVLAVIHDYVQVAGGPTTGSHTPAVALGKILDRTRRSVSDLTRIEINEAFAATPLVSALFLAKGDRRGADRILEKTNLCGGAVAIGHPIGASGARLVMTLVNGLRLSGGVGVAAICGGYGQGDATLIEAA